MPTMVLLQSRLVTDITDCRLFIILLLLMIPQMRKYSTLGFLSAIN